MCAVACVRLFERRAVGLLRKLITVSTLPESMTMYGHRCFGPRSRASSGGRDPRCPSTSRLRATDWKAQDGDAAPTTTSRPTSNRTMLEVHSAFHGTREADWKPRGEYRVDRPTERATNEIRRPARSTVTVWSFLIRGAKMHFSRTQTAWNSTRPRGTSVAIDTRGI